jgi:hypothetical protein
LFISCKKEKELEKESLQNGALLIAPGAPSTGSTCVDMLEDETQPDSLLTETILGNPLNGHPYSVATMRQAAVNLYGNDQGIVANKVYMRCKPANETQLEALEATNAEWFDYPLDRDVLQQGDYYTQPGIGPEEISWLYAVVDIGYTIPAGITYEVLENIYVPDDNLVLEKEAFVITGNGAAYMQDCSIVPSNPVPCDPYTLEGCPGDGSLPGGGGSGSHSKRPEGFITVEDTQLPGTASDHKFPLRQVRVVCKRFLKIVTTYTDDNGHFAVAKKFHNKVHIIVKFKNNNITTRGLRGWNFWQMKFPVKYSLGKFSGTLNNINYTFTRGSNTNFRQHRNWWAAQLMNSYLEYNEMAVAQNVGQLPTGLCVLLSSWGAASTAGSTTMDRHRIMPSIPNQDYIGYYIADPRVNTRLLVGNWLVNGQFMRLIDMSLGYNTPYAWESDKVKQLIYHEMSHAAHFNKVGEGWYSQLTTAELYTIAKWGATSPNAPYGIGDDGNVSQIIALGESWAEHIGQFFTDLRYGANSSWDFNQGFFYFNSTIQNSLGTTVAVTGLNTHVNLLEDYSPFRLDDNTHWIPYGLYYDLIDDRNDNIAFPPRVAIDDQVLGYTNQQLFNAMDNDINNPVDYRVRLLNENNNNQSINLITIFNRYDY